MTPTSPLLPTSDAAVVHASRNPVAKMPVDDLTTRAIRMGFAAFGEVAPGVMAWAAMRLFTSPRRFATPPRERDHLAMAERFAVDTAVGSVACYRWSTHDLPWERRAQATVLLMHGWEGRGSQLCAFVDGLIAHGFDVVAFDGPAHGASGGDRADAPTFSVALRDVAAAVGNVRFVIAHSMGAVATGLAVVDGLDVDGVALLAPPVSVDTVTADFCQSLGTTPRTEQELRRRLRERFHPYLWERLSFEAHTPPAVPALIVHDVDDREVPFARGHALAQAWPGATLLPTRGLGHRRVLRDAAIVDEVTRFVVAQAKASAAV